MNEARVSRAGGSAAGAERAAGSAQLTRAFSAIEEAYLRERTGNCRLETPADAELLIDGAEEDVELAVQREKSWRKDTRMKRPSKPDPDRQAKRVARLGMAAVATLHELCLHQSDWTTSRSIWEQIRRMWERHRGLVVSRGDPVRAYEDLLSLSVALRHVLGSMDDQSVWRAMSLQVAVAACDVLVSVVWAGHAGEGSERHTDGTRTGTDGHGTAGEEVGE